MESDCVLDCTGMRCPSPILHLSKAIRTQLAPGQIVRVECNDPAFEPDVRAFCRQTGNTLLSIEEVGASHSAFIQKKAA